MNFKIKIISQIIDVIFPIECLGCGKEGKWICEECARLIPVNDKIYCLGCKRETNFGEFCEKCSAGRNLDGVFIASDYDNKLIKSAIKTLKYKFVKDISRELGKLLVLFLREQRKKAQFSAWLNESRAAKDAPKILADFYDVIVIPVPLHKKRQKWRGFNQAEGLARYIAENFNLAVNTKDLRRVKNTKAQAKLNEEDRQNNLTDSFGWQGYTLNNKNIIIIDDVATTGATLEECAKVLKKAGAGEVWGAVVAKG